MQIRNVFRGIDAEISHDFEFNELKTNSNEITNGDVFVCIHTGLKDRHDFIDEAAKNGAIAAIVDREVESEIQTIRVENVNDIYDSLFANYNDNPQNECELVAITGTDGKTSTALIFQQLFGNDCAYFGTNGAKFQDHFFPLKNTTPDSNQFYHILRNFVDLGCKTVVLEFSSEAEHYQRLKNLKFDIIALTNVSSEHLNTHGTLENYYQAKRDVFLKHSKNNGKTIAVINSDDDFVENTFINSELKNSDIIFKSFSLNSTSKEDKELLENSKLIGDFNKVNLLTALTILKNCSPLFNYDFDILKHRIQNLKLDGRLEEIETNFSFRLFIDFAHTPNAVQTVLNAMRKEAIKSNSKIISVFGQPGGRDSSKRPAAGKAVVEGSDFVILTADDPRSEDVEKICNQMLAEIDRETIKEKVEIIVDRETAVKEAINLAKENDIVMLLGKGAETRQVVEDKHIPYSDKETALKCLNEFKNKN